MKQKFTILFDLDGTLVDTAPDLMRAHNHVMKKFGYPTKSTEEIRNLVGKGAGAMIGRSIWGQAKKEFGKVDDEKIKKEMVKEFVEFYARNIINESTLINGVKEFLKWCKENGISMAVCIKKCIMIGDSETDANAGKNAGIPVILLEDGYTEKKISEIYHDHLIKDFIGVEKIISKYL